MIHRAHHGFKFGEHSTTYGFFRCLKSEIDRHNPSEVFLVTEGYPKHRVSKFSEYKANRIKKNDDDFSRQKNDIFDISKNLPITIINHPDYECDDVIAMLSQQYHKNNKVVICSSDSDFIQLLTIGNVSLWNPIKKCFVEQWPVDYLTWKSLKGDPSDNIPGVSGVGQKTAFKLAADKNLLKNYMEKNPEKQEQYDISYFLIKLADLSNNDPKINKNKYTFQESALKSSFRERSFNSIIEKSWVKWENTMRSLNERSKEANI